MVVAFHPLFMLLFILYMVVAPHALSQKRGCMRFIQTVIYFNLFIIFFGLNSFFTTCFIALLFFVPVLASIYFFFSS